MGVAIGFAVMSGAGFVVWSDAHSQVASCSSTLGQIGQALSSSTTAACSHFATVEWIGGLVAVVFGVLAVGRFIATVRKP